MCRIGRQRCIGGGKDWLGQDTGLCDSGALLLRFDCDLPHIDFACRCGFLVGVVDAGEAVQVEVDKPGRTWRTGDFSYS